MARKRERKNAPKGKGSGTKAFGGRLKSIMNARGISPAQLARETGIGGSTIFRYLKGEREPVYDNLVDIATALDVRLDLLAGREVKGAERAVGLLIDEFVRDLRLCLGLDAPDGPSTEVAPPRIPIVGTTSKGSDIRFSRNGLPTGRAIREIPSLGDDDPNAYAVVFEGDSMTSRILHGDVVVCCPHAEWKSGELGLLRTTDGEIVVREILDRKSFLLLRSFSAAYDLEEVEASKASFIHKVTSIRPSAQSDVMTPKYQA